MKIISSIICVVLAILIIYCLASCSSLKQSKQNESRFSKKEKKGENPYRDYRNLAFQVTLEQLKIKLDNENTIVYGMIMDWGVKGGVATVVAFITGDASMYLSGGQIYIGGYAHENIKNSALAFVKGGQKYLSKASLTLETNVPDDKHIRFYFLTNKGKYCIQESVENIQNNKSDYCYLFNLGNDIITQYRK